MKILFTNVITETKYKVFSPFFHKKTHFFAKKCPFPEGVP